MKLMHKLDLEMFGGHEGQGLDMVIIEGRLRNYCSTASGQLDDRAYSTT